MKKTIAKSLLVGAVVLLAVQAPAYTLFSEDTTVRETQWPPSSNDATLTGGGFPDSALPAQWRLNTSGSDNVTFAVLGGILDDVIAEFNAIANVPTLYGREANTASGFNLGDNQNTISFLESNWAATTSTPTGVLAFAQGNVFGSPFDDYQATNDILFNGDTHTWSNAGASGTFDIQSVLTHEMGHATGLDHSPVLGATMFPLSPAIGDGGVPGTRARTLAADDIAGVQALYGGTAGTGTITGTIDSDIGGEAIAVIAINQTTGDTIAALTGNTTGSANEDYVMAAVPPGSYFVAAMPLDDSVFGMDATNVGQFSTPDTVFSTRVYSSSSSTGTSLPGSGTLVVVTSGATTSNINIDPPDTANTENLYYASNSLGFAAGGANVSSSGDTFQFGVSSTTAITPAFTIPSSATFLATSNYTGSAFTGAGIFGEDVGIYQTTLTSTDAVAGTLRTIAINYNSNTQLDILPGAVEFDFTSVVNTNPTISISGNVNVTQNTTNSANQTIGTTSDAEDANGSLSLSVTNVTPSATGLNINLSNSSGNVVVASVSADCTTVPQVYTVTVRTQDSGSLTATDTFTVTVVDDTFPTVGTYPAAGTVTAGITGITVTPDVAPSDAEGSIVLGTVTGGSTFDANATATANTSTGVVTINTTGSLPDGTYNLQATFTDECDNSTMSNTFNIIINSGSGVKDWEAAD